MLFAVLVGGPAWAGLSTGVIDTVVGGLNGDGFDAEVAKIGPAGLAFDANGNWFIADASGNRLLRIDGVSNLTSTIAGTGTGGYNGDGGLGTAAQLAVPSGVAVDGGGNIYVADLLNSRVRRIDARTGVITTATGGTFGADGLAYPAGLMFAPDGTLLIADSVNYRVQRLNLSTGTVTTVAGVVGSYGYNGDNQLATTAKLTNPSDVAVDASGNVYIADTGNCRVRKVEARTHVISTVAGSGTETSSENCAYSGDNGPATAATLNGPTNIALDGTGHLFIAESFQPRVRMVDFTTGLITTVAGTGLGGNSGDGGAATAAQLTQVSGLRVNANFLYISDSGAGTVRQVVLQAQSPFTGVITTVLGGANGDGFDAETAKIGPAGLAFDAHGNWFIADASGNRLRRIDGVSNLISTIAGTGTGGYSGDGGPGSDAELAVPSGVAVDGGGNTYVAELFNSRVRRIDARTGVITTATGGTFGAGGLAYPAGLVFAPDGTLLIADSVNYRVQRLNLSTGAVTTVAGVVGSYGYDGDNQLATNAKLTNPSDVAADTDGNVYIADTGNCRVRKVDAQTQVISTVAGSGTETSSGQCAWAGDNGPATAATLNGPTNIALDANGHLFIAESFQPRVRMVDFNTGLITTVVGTGLAGNSGDGGSATAARLNQPSGVRVDATGSFLYIADGANGNVRRVQLVSTVGAGAPTPTSTEIATPTRTPAPAATPTGLVSFTVSGQVLYYSNGLPVSAAMVELNAGSTTIVQRQTDAAGRFTLPNVQSGNWQIQPSKIGDVSSAMSVLDAIYALQASVGLRTLSSAQQLACNVAGNGSLGALDAILILRHTVGLITSFPVAQACGSDWAFMPQAASTLRQQLQVSAGSCQPGAIALQPLVGSVTNQNFTAVLFGDCSGAWQPSHTSNAVRNRGTSSEVRLGQPTYHGRRLRIPIRVQAHSDFEGLDATLAYDATQLTVHRVSLTGDARQALFEMNSGIPGTLKLALASGKPLRSGILLRVEFDTVKRARAIPSVRLVGATVLGE